MVNTKTRIREWRSRSEKGLVGFYQLLPKEFETITDYSCFDILNLGRNIYLSFERFYSD